MFMQQRKSLEGVDITKGKDKSLYHLWSMDQKYVVILLFVLIFFLSFS